MGIKLHIRLENGIEIKRTMTKEDIKKAENNKYFKKITSQNDRDFKKYQQETYHSWHYKDDKKIEKRFEDLISYIDFLNCL